MVGTIPGPDPNGQMEVQKKEKREMFCFEVGTRFSLLKLGLGLLI
jgi:hypothetical protein